MNKNLLRSAGILSVGMVVGLLISNNPATNENDNTVCIADVMNEESVIGTAEIGKRLMNHDKMLDMQQDINAMDSELMDTKKILSDTETLLKETQSELDKTKKELENLQVQVRNRGKIGVQLGLSDADVNLLYRLVEAEAGAEPIEGRIAVANVIINRIKSDKYPATMREVIYQKNQFEVVNIGTIDTKVPKESTKEAVMRALNGEKAVGDNIMMFWATYLPKSHRLWNHCTPLKTIGTHHFTDEWR